MKIRDFTGFGHGHGYGNKVKPVSRTSKPGSHNSAYDQARRDAERPAIIEQLLDKESQPLVPAHFEGPLAEIVVYVPEKAPDRAVIDALYEAIAIEGVMKIRSAPFDNIKTTSIDFYA